MAERSEIEEIKQRLDIITVATEYIPNLKRSGRNHFAPCPFHNEKTPSFSINEDIQRFKCFGCGEAGDVITFIQKMEGVDFPKALELSAKRAGVQLQDSEYNKSNSKSYREKQELYKVNFAVAEYYHQTLMKAREGEEGRQYSNKRKLGLTQIKDFMIGYAPEGYENLKNFLIKKGFKPEDLVKWSLLVSKNNKVYDKFRKRLMFPVFSHVGDVVGFSGRVIDKEDIPKYLNSSETPVYKKSEVLYGLFQGKDQIRRTKEVIIVEGNVDVPMAHKKGVKNIVAPMGTALTEKQLLLLKRYADTVIFAFDSDSAGEKALLRSYQLTEKIGLKSKAINLGEYGDLDDLIQSAPQKLQEVIEKADTVIRNLITRYSKRLDLGTARGKAEFVELLTDPVSKIVDQVEQTHYVQLISSSVSVDEKIVWSKIMQNRKDNAKSQSLRVSSKTSIYENENIEEVEQDNFHNQTIEISAKEKYAIGFLLQYDFLRNKQIEWDIFSSKGVKEIYDKLIGSQNTKEGLAKLDVQYQDIATDLLMQDLGEFETNHEVERFFDEVIKELTKKYLSLKLKSLKLEIREKEAVGEDVEGLMAELGALTAKLKSTN